MAIGQDRGDLVVFLLVCSYIRNEHLLGSNYWTAGFFQRGQGGAVAPPELRRSLALHREIHLGLRRDNLDFEKRNVE